MGMLAAGMGWLAGVFAGEAITVRYIRNNVTYQLAVFVSSQTRQTDPLGQSPAFLNTTDRVYSVKISDWRAAGLVGEPRTGDVIQEWLSGTPVRFEVRPPDDLTSAWSYGEPEEITYSIRAARVHNLG